jgi:hypothetical protein
MAFQSVPNGVEIVLNGVQNGIPIVNVFNVIDVTTPTIARLTTIATTVKTWWDASMAPILNTSYVLQSIKVTALTAATGPQFIQTYSSGNQGTNSGGEAAANAAAVISWRTASIGRSFRGRTYVGALSEGEIDSAQTIATATQTALLSMGTSLITALAGISCVLAVLSRYAAKVLRVTGILTEIISVVVDNKVDSQRRRTAN